ncbi:MAG: nitrogenase [Lachnospiraceae bacterium]|nr:nitrogenase [Lachnospiraceae bacterium]
MLKKATDNTAPVRTGRLKITEAPFPVPFYMGLEYSTPARGMWNISHTGMLMPESHQIFVCAYGCLRGVVLTAAEMNAMGRYSALSIREHDIITGSIESLMIDGVTDILNKLPYRPKCVQIFISCQHFFLSYDHNNVFERIREAHPDIVFLDCYMIPAMRKSGISPEQRMRRQMTRVWQERTGNDRKRINILGSNLRLSETCELRSWLAGAGYELKSIHDCTTFAEYLDMANAGLNIYYEPVCAAEMKDLKKRLDMDSFYFTNSFQFDEIDAAYNALAERLGIPAPDMSAQRAAADEAMKQAHEVIGDTPVAVDFTFTTRITSFAKMLADYGFNVRAICTDLIQPEDKAAFEALRESHPDIDILATNQPESRFFAGEHEEMEKSEETGRRYLAVGQKAAYFFATDYFVNVAEGGGFLGYDGIVKIAELLIDAYENRKERRALIRRKGFGCESCV